MGLVFLMGETVFCSMGTEKRREKIAECIQDRLNYQNLRVCFQTYLMIILRHTVIVSTFTMCFRMHHTVINLETSNSCLTLIKSLEAKTHIPILLCVQSLKGLLRKCLYWVQYMQAMHQGARKRCHFQELAVLTKGKHSSQAWQSEVGILCP